MKILIGPIAEKEYYFERTGLNTLFYKKLAQHHHLSITAPRRVGKSSFMKNISQLNKENYSCLYTITESINEPNEFFKKIYTLLFSHVSTLKKLKEFLDGKLKSLSIRKISLTGIEFDRKDISFYEELKELLKALNSDDHGIILLIDEYSQTIENIIKDQGKTSAAQFLHQCRELRVSQGKKNNVHFVYAGSIGLENLVSSIGETRSINDLGHFDVPPLDQTETKAFIHKIMDGEKYQFSSENQDYFIQKMRWLLPFYIQIAMAEIEQLLLTKNQHNINKEIIDQAFENVLESRNYFDHWFVRLRSIFQGQQFNIAKAILNHCAEKGMISIFEIQDIAKKFNLEEFRDILNILVHDGYIVKQDKAYRFNSPLLEQWWYKNIFI